MKRVIDVVRQAIRRGVRVVAVGLNRFTKGALHPNMVTIFGLIMHLPIAYLIVVDQWIAQRLCEPDARRSQHSGQLPAQFGWVLHTGSTES